MSAQPTPSKHSRLVLFLILAVVIGPFLFAWILVKRSETHHFKTSNHGDLISSPRNIADVEFGKKLLGKWWLVYVSPQKCHQECQDVLYNMKQLQTALGKDATRVERLFVPHPNCPNDICETYLSEFYPDLTRATFNAKDFNALFLNPNSGYSDEMLGDIYIVDPLGSIMMHYSPDMDPKNILTDVKRLLRASKIG